MYAVSCKRGIIVSLIIVCCRSLLGLLSGVEGGRSCVHRVGRYVRPECTESVGLRESVRSLGFPLRRHDWSQVLLLCSATADGWRHDRRLLQHALLGHSIGCHVWRTQLHQVSARRYTLREQRQRKLNGPDTCRTEPAIRSPHRRSHATTSMVSQGLYNKQSGSAWAGHMSAMWSGGWDFGTRDDWVSNITRCTHQLLW